MKITKADSSLVSYLDPNGTTHYNTRTAAVDCIIPHHAANGTGCGRGYNSNTLAVIFASVGRGGSVNYGIDSSGKIGQQLPEQYRPWTSNSRTFDMRAVTIEVANDGGAPDWHISDKALSALAALCTDICKRRGKKKLVWIANKSSALAYKPAKDEMLLLIHAWVADAGYPTGCPGPYMISKMPYLAETVTKALGGKSAAAPAGKTKFQPYIIRITFKRGMNIRTQPGINGGIVGTVPYRGLYTIVEEKTVSGQVWGRLKSGAGWICLTGFTERYEK